MTKTTKTIKIWTVKPENTREFGSWRLEALKKQKGGVHPEVYEINRYVVVSAEKTKGRGDKVLDKLERAGTIKNLNMGDIIEIEGKVAYYVDYVGFKKVAF